MRHRLQGQRPALRLQSIIAGSRSTSRSALLAATLTMVSALAGIADAAAADVAQPSATLQKDFAIPAGPLNEALGQLAADTGISITAAPALVDGVKTAGLKGRYAVPEALALLLVGTGLQAIDQGGGAYALSRLPVAKGIATVMPAVQVTAEVERPLTGPTAGPTSTATRIPVDTRQVPQSVGVVSTELLEEAGGRSITDSVALISGVSREVAQGFGSGIVVRGFGVGSSSLVDGLRFPSNNRRRLEERALYERIEVLKGHSSVLYGSGAPGGTVNYVTRKPSFDRLGSVEFAVGPDNYRRGVVDLAGPVSETLAYRLIGVAENYDYYTTGPKDDRVVAAPSLMWKAPTDGALLLQYEYSDTSFREPFNAVVINNAIAPYRRTDTRAEEQVESNNIKANFTQPLARDWNLVLDGDYAAQDNGDASIRFRPNSSTDPTASIGSYFQQDSKDRGRVLRGEVQGSFALGFSRHRLLAGIDDFHNKGRTERHFSATFGEGPLFDPNFGAPLPEPLATPVRFASSNDEQGLYVNDFIDLTNKTHLLIGVRRARYESRDDISGVKDADTTATTPSAGLVYDLHPQLSIYASGGRSFQPNGGTDRNNQFFDAMRGTQQEAGFKADAFDKTLNITAAAFKLVQDNLTTTDPVDPNFSALLGEVTIKGFELDANWQIGERLTFIGVLTSLDSEITKNNDGQLGKRRGNTPDFSATARLSYRADHGLRFGGQVLRVGDRRGSDFADFEVPAYTRVDLDASWQVYGQYRFSANIENLFDEDYVLDSFDVNQVTLGRPRTLVLRARYDF